MAAQRPVHIDSTTGNVRELVAGDKIGGITNGTATGEALTFDAIGVSVQAYDADLAAIVGLSNGLVAITGAGTAAARTITGTTNQVTVSNGDGVSGNPTLSLPQSIAMISTPTFAGATIDGHSIGRGAFSNESNLRVGVGSLAANSSGTSNLALGPYALANTVSSAGLVGIGYGAGSHLLDGSTPLTDSDHSVYLGDDTRASADNVIHEIVIGSGGRGIGAGTTVVGTTNSTAFRAWGTPTFGPANSLTLGLGSLTAARTLTVPDVSSTILVASDIGASVQAYSASTTLLGNTVTGTGSIVLATSPTLVTPVLGVASATSLACPTFTSAAAFGFTPAAGSGFNVTLSGAGDFAVNTSQLYIDTSAGNVGIGTTSPTSLLTVNQAANTTDGTQATYGFQLSNQGTANITIGSSASVTYIQSWASKPLVVNSQGNNTLLNPTSGDVGIGTTSPSAKLHAISTTEQLRLGYDSSNYLSTTVSSAGVCTITPTGSAPLAYIDGKLHVGSYSSTNYAMFVYQSSSAGGGPAALVVRQDGTDPIQIWQGNGGGVKAQINSDGNFGIGASAFGTSAAKVLGIGNGTEPSTSPADMIQLYSVDLSAGNATLGLRTETAVVTESVTSDRTLSVRINGTTYKICLKA